MIDIAAKYQASVFGDLTSIEPTPEVISKLLVMFRDKNLLPSTFQEIGPLNPAPLPRIQLTSSNKEWIIRFATGRIDVEKHPTDPKGGNLGTAEGFTEEANDMFSRILAEFNKKGNRIALITSGLLKEMSEGKLSDIYGKLFNPIKYYRDTPPFEWNSRSVARMTMDIDGSAELLNVITNVNRAVGQQMLSDTVLKIDRIEIGFDINTIAENKDFRFGSRSIGSFYLEAIKIRSYILLELEGFLDA